MLQFFFICKFFFSKRSHSYIFQVHTLLILYQSQISKKNDPTPLKSLGPKSFQTIEVPIPTVSTSNYCLNPGSKCLKSSR